MYLPMSMTWNEAIQAPYEQLVEAYTNEGRSRALAEEWADGGVDWMVQNTPEWCQRLGMNPGPGEYVLWEMKKQPDLTTAEVIETKFPFWRR